MFADEPVRSDDRTTEQTTEQTSPAQKPVNVPRNLVSVIKRSTFDRRRNGLGPTVLNNLHMYTKEKGDVKTDNHVIS